MAAIRVQDRFAPDAPFRFLGGDASLDFVNTVDWTPRGLERDRFTTYDRVIEWAQGASVLGGTEAGRLRGAAGLRPREAVAALDAARQARLVLRELVVAVVNGFPRAAGLEGFNALLADAGAQTRLVRDAAGGLVRGWAGLGDALESVLWPVVWAAADLVSSSDVARLRMCAGHDCGWLYVDRSRNGLRRWCEMSVCGTAEKNRRRAQRASGKKTVPVPPV